MVKGFVIVSVSIDDGTTMKLRGEIDLAARTFIVVGHVEAADEFSDEHDELLRKAFECLARTDYKETLVRVDAEEDQAGGPEN